MLYDKTTTNIYVEYQDVYELQEHIDVQVLATNILDKQKIKPTNINYSILTWEYINDYQLAIKPLKRNYTKKDKKGNIKQNIEAVSFKTLLPKGLSVRNKAPLREYCNYFIEEIRQGNQFMWYAYVTTFGKAKFINFIILDRMWYPEGKEVIALRSETQWRDKKGVIRTYTKEDEKSGLITLYCTKGDEYKKTIYLSDKIRFQGINTRPNSEEGKILFKLTFERIKFNLMNYFHKKFYLKIYECEMFFKKNTYKTLKKKAFYTNQTIYFHDKWYYIKRRKVKAINEVYDAFNNYIAIHTYNDKTLLKKAYDVIDEETKKLKKINKVREVETIAIKLIEEIKNGTLLNNVSGDVYELACAVFGKEHVKNISA